MKVEKLLELKNRMERIIANYIAKMGEDYLEVEKSMNIISPPADIYLDGNRQIIFLETPGIVSSTVDISYRNGMLVFKAEKKKPEKLNRKYIHMERNIGNYFKIVPLEMGEKDITGIEHTYKYGVIKIEVSFGDKE